MKGLTLTLTLGVPGGHGPPLRVLGHAGEGLFEALTSDLLLSERHLLQQGVVLHLQPPHVLLNLLHLILQLQPSSSDTSQPPLLLQQPKCIMGEGVEQIGPHVSHSFRWSSPGSLLLQKVVFVLDLKLQLCHLTGELKEQSDVTGVQSVALPTVATRGSSGTNLERNIGAKSLKKWRNQKTNISHEIVQNKCVFILSKQKLKVMS